MRAWVLVVAACGSQAPAPSKPAPPPPPTVPQQRVITPEAFCDRMIALAQCPWAKQFAVERKECVDTLSQSQYQAFRDKFGPCVLDHSDCGEIAKCISDSAVEKTDLRACSDRDASRTVGMPRAEWEKRKGAHVTKFSQAKTTRDAPVEVCGIPAENQWLVDAACDDGSHPFRDTSDAEGSRAGNVGEAGRCGSIIDLYKVKCPEASYDIYLDGYVCPQ